MRVVEPGFNGDSVLRLQQKALGRVVDDHGLGEVPVDLREVFDVELFARKSMFSVQSVTDVFRGGFLVIFPLGCGPNVPKRPISVIPHPSRKNDYLIVAGHLLEEGQSKGPHSDLVLRVVKVK